MNCEILQTIYLRSNGDIPCYCGPGEQLQLGRVETDDPFWNISKVLTNENYTHIRNSLSSGVAPWPDICNKCEYLQKEEPFSDKMGKNRIVNKIMLEPTLACNLECPGCSNKVQIQTRPKPQVMKLEMWEGFFKSLSENSYLLDEVKECVYCGQGDPLMHPQFSEFIKIAREYCPNAHQTVSTNGNFDYWKTLRGVFIDTIHISCDGLYQKSYEKYRIGGKVERAIKFMKDIPKTIDGEKQNLAWKYILFEFNDSDEEIKAAQHLANSIGIDTLMFIFTHSKFKSEKYTPQNAKEFPILYKNVLTSATIPLEKKLEGQGNLMLRYFPKPKGKNSYLKRIPKLFHTIGNVVLKKT